MPTTDLATITNHDTILEAEEGFLAQRNSAFQAIADTARAAIRYGSLVNELREKLGSEKEFAKCLTAIGAKLPIEETHKLMKVAARAQQEGDSLFLDKSKATWAQSEMGLLPPPAPTERSKPAKLFTPADAIAAIVTAVEVMAKVTEAVPWQSWTPQERELFTKQAELLTPAKESIKVG